MNKNNTTLLNQALALSPIFAGCQSDKLNELSQSRAFEVISTADGDEVKMSAPPFPGLGIVLSGRYIVRRCDSGHAVNLNELSPGDSFGAVSMFRSDKTDQVTQVLSKGAARVAVISEADFRRLLIAESDVCMGYITFLSDRVRFLNGKVRTFSGSTAAKKVANAMLSDESGGIYSAGSYAEFARRLNIGRASLYRALDSMEEDGLILRKGSSVRIIDKERLAQI